MSNSKVLYETGLRDHESGLQELRLYLAAKAAEQVSQVLDTEYITEELVRNEVPSAHSCVEWR